MASVLRRLGFKKHEPRESEARQKLQRELFAFNQCVEHGFPHRPTALAHDPKLKLMAIGTKNGDVRVMGRPGVEYSGRHADDVEVNKLFFLPEQGRLLSLCSDNSLHLWEINTKDGEAVIEQVRSVKMDASKVKSVTACCLTSSAEQLFLGTESGNIHVLHLPDLALSDNIIYQDVLMQNVPDDLKVNPGPVETIAQHPSKPEKFLVGYNRGLVVLWDNKESQAEQTYNSSQQLESLAWHRDGTQFMSAHADGSYLVWSTSDSTKPKEQSNTPYGPFPCKAINKIQWKTAKSDPFIIFSGGMPRASYGDRHTVTAMQGENNHAVFDFASKVIDFVTICSASELEDYDKFEYDDPHSLLVLTEEEVVAVDLQSEGWPQFSLPYMNSLHSSAIMCTAHVSSVPDAFWTKIVDAGEPQFASYSTRDWPITGGQTLPQSLGAKSLLLTGHEDGSVRFWDVSTTSQKLMYTLKTASIFGCDMGALDNADEDEGWPPFKKVGTFDPYSDDPRLGIQKLTLCPLSETLTVSGTAGQTVVMQWEREERTQEIKVTQVNIVTDTDGFVWKGHEALAVKGGEVTFTPGFQPVCVMQLHPPAAATAQALHSEWQLLAVGTAHGFAVFDYSQRVEVASMCTLNPSDLSGAAESGPMSRAKTFKKSLRQSFRRLRKGRHSGEDTPKTKSPKSSPKKTKPDSPKKEEKKDEPGPSSIEAPAGEETKTEEAPAEAAAAPAESAPAEEGAAAPAEATATPPAQPEEAPAQVETVVTGDTSTKPVEREISARSEKSPNEEMASMVRSLCFADTFLMNSQHHGPTVWAGTNSGNIYAYQATLPENDKRDSEPVKCVLGKEIKLQHKAPVISMTVIDRTATPLPAALEVQHERAKAPNMTGQHQLVVCSEEQFKIFSLPSLKASTKYKLTAHEGCKIRRVGFVNFRSKSDERYQENDLAILTNQGDVQVWTIPQLRRQLKANCVRKENVSGIVSAIFTQSGEGFFLASPSEFLRFSLSARFVPKAACEILLKDGVRPALPEPEPEKAAEPEAAATEVPIVVETPAAPTEGEAAAAETPAEQKKEEPTTDETPKDETETEAKQEEGSGDVTLNVTSADDSVAVADTTGEITLDSVKIHLNESTFESSESSKVEVVESSRQSTTMTVTKTVVTETSEGGEVTSRQETVTTTTSEMSESGDAGATGGSGPNLDDDSKLTNHGEEIETVGTNEDLKKLYISEDGDEMAHQCPDVNTEVPENTTQQQNISIPSLEISDSPADVPEGVSKTEYLNNELITGPSPTESANGDVSENRSIEKEVTQNEANEKSECLVEIEEFTAPVLVGKTECSAPQSCMEINQSEAGEKRECDDACSTAKFEEHPGDEIIEFTKGSDDLEIEDCAPFEIETPIDESEVPSDPVRRSIALDDLIDNLQEIASTQKPVAEPETGNNEVIQTPEVVIETEEECDLANDKEAIELSIDNESALDEPAGVKFQDDIQIESIAENLVAEVLGSVLQSCAGEPNQASKDQDKIQSENDDDEEIQLLPESINGLPDGKDFNKDGDDSDLSEYQHKEETAEQIEDAHSAAVDNQSHTDNVEGVVKSQETPEGIFYYVTTVAGIPPNQNQVAGEEQGSLMTVAGIEPMKRELADPVEIARYDASDEEYEYVEILEEVEVTDEEVEKEAGETTTGNKSQDSMKAPEQREQPEIETGRSGGDVEDRTDEWESISVSNNEGQSGIVQDCIEEKRTEENGDSDDRKIASENDGETCSSIIENDSSQDKGNVVCSDEHVTDELANASDQNGDTSVPATIEPISGEHIDQESVCISSTQSGESESSQQLGVVDKRVDFDVREMSSVHVASNLETSDKINPVSSTSAIEDEGPVDSGDNIGSEQVDRGVVNGAP